MRRVDTSCLFWMVWKMRNMIAFRYELLSIQKLKASFVFILWSETELNLVDIPHLLIGWDVD